MSLGIEGREKLREPRDWDGPSPGRFAATLSPEGRGDDNGGFGSSVPSPLRGEGALRSKAGEGMSELQKQKRRPLRNGVSVFDFVRDHMFLADLAATYSPKP